MKLFQLLDLFSGIGGFSLGLERSGGFETKAFCEIDPYCKSVLAGNWPKVPIYEDVRLLSGALLKRDGIAINAICGGFPCQDISAAREVREGLRGAQSGLWFEYRRLIDELRPQIIIVENVERILGNGLIELLKDLAALGYDAEWHTIPASSIGAPHRRDRVWIVAYPMCERLEGLYRQGWGKFAKPAREALWRQWEAPPAMVRVADGLPDRLVRNPIQALGNAVVPQVAEMIGRAIMESLTPGKGLTARHRTAPCHSSGELN